MICTPALLYVILCSIQIILDFINGLYNTAVIKIGITIVMTFILNILCDIDLGIVSWIIVLIPFLFMTIIASIILVSLGLDKSDGTPINNQQQHSQQPIKFTSPPLSPWSLPDVTIQQHPPEASRNLNYPISNGIYLIM